MACTEVMAPVMAIAPKDTAAIPVRICCCFFVTGGTGLFHQIDSAEGVLLPDFFGGNSRGILRGVREVAGVDVVEGRRAALRVPGMEPGDAEALRCRPDVCVGGLLDLLLLGGGVGLLPEVGDITISLVLGSCVDEGGMGN